MTDPSSFASPQALGQEALRLASAGNLSAAEPLFARLVELLPQEVRAWSGLGRCRLELGRSEAALVALRMAADLAPGDPSTAINLAGALVRLSRHADALDVLDRVATLHADNAVLAFNRGRALQALDRGEEAREAFDLALGLDPRLVPALSSRAQLLAEHGDVASAMMDLDQILTQRPGDLRARVRRAELALASGDWIGGLADYETRLDMPPSADGWRPGVALRRHEDISGRDILVFAEPRDEAAATAETLQMLRLAPAIAERAGRVTLEVPRPLASWCSATLPATLGIVSRGAPSNAEIAVPWRSLLSICDVDPSRLPMPWPTIDKPPREGRPRTIGVAPFASGPSALRRARDVPLAALEILKGLPNLRWVALQPMADSPHWLSQSGLPATPDAIQVNDVLASLDMVVAADNWIGHLAGVNGQRLALMLDRSPDWSWLTVRSDTPWYPSARLYRQSNRGDWRAPLAALRRELDALP